MESKHVDIYHVLNIPFSNNAPILSKQQIKIAYHKALLKYHPDKAASTAAAKHLPSFSRQRVPSSESDTAVAYTVDEITYAYKTLSDPVLRAEYDRQLRLQRNNGSGGRLQDADVFHTGLEVMDLEDLNYSDDSDESKGFGGEEADVYWFRGCRCGDEKGFIVTEDELEAEALHGEIVVGCRGCSLWIKVLFAVAEDGQHDAS
ncbi:Diphthamide biosynthesis protein 4 [Talaromyces proteolyticus]|uniref:Diphthamide biosynthesis protein 4 n=1 Tax=Talaromyces proteolyticus TaxID=1131652 RepID=A0AAD4KVB5_9EURO|nr:Diphthamide biosynthesis protein 4 [Talaromyces proteolyticus]KAH8700263.1 Diphthamide biosynthesis protein 4 [Talaromyces proteolyticus]